MIIGHNRLKSGWVALVAAASVLVLVLAVAGRSTGNSPSTAAWPGSATLGLSAGDDFQAKAATDGRHLWVVDEQVTRASGQTHAALLVYLWDGNGWSRMAPIGATPDHGAELSLGVWHNDVCASYVEQAQGRIACFNQRRWRIVTLPGRMTTDEVAFGVGAPVVVATLHGDRHTTFKLVGNSIQHLGWPVNAKRGVIPTIGTGDGKVFLFGRATRNHAASTLYQLTPHGWVQHGPNLAVAANGPQIGGPVATSDGVTIALSSAGGNAPGIRSASLAGGRWTLGPQLSQIGISAQGDAVAIDGKPYLLWQEQSELRDDTFRSVATLATADGARRRVLFDERNIGPGDLQILRAGQQWWLLSLRASPAAPGKGLHLHVEPVADLAP